MTIRIVVVDDHVIVRTGMCMLLAAEPELDVVGQAGCGETALPLLRKLRPDVLVCDVHLPGISGIEVVERVVRGGYGPRVIMVSALQEGPMPRRAMAAGASAYVGKGNDVSELLRAVRDVSLGKRYLANGIAQQLALSGIDGRGASPFDVLSPRELEVAMLLAQGLRQDEIARRLSLSAKTINTHKTRLFEKLEIQDGIALARMASRYGLADPALAW
jgi:DNA-binding NarL/FixJ family response regulator